jgi:hypothetical protein
MQVFNARTIDLWNFSLNVALDWKLNLLNFVLIVELIFFELLSNNNTQSSLDKLSLGRDLFQNDRSSEIENNDWIIKNRQQKLLLFTI